MNAIVIYKSKYGSTKAYAEWIAEELACTAVEAKSITPAELEKYDRIVYGGGLYAEIINGASLITKNADKLADKKIAVFSTGITPLEYREYYDVMVIEKNFKNGVPSNVRVFNFMGKMILDELSFVHRTSLKALKKLMSGKEMPTEMEMLLAELCDANGDFSDRLQIKELVEYIKE